MNVNVLNGKISDEEKKLYREYALEHTDGRELESLDVNLDNEYVDLTYHFNNVPFERIRRITGYLVGTIDRFNNSKKAEVRDRVKHMTIEDL